MKNKLPILYFPLAFFIFYHNAIFAQISGIGTPKSTEIRLSKNVPEIDLGKIYRHQINNNETTPELNFFARVIKVSISNKKSGIWEHVPGGKIWRVKLISSGAISLNFTFNKYKLPKNSSLYVYNTNKTHIRGPFTSKNNKKSGILAVAPVDGDEIIIEYFEPKNTEFEAELEINRVGHAFTGTTETRSPDEVQTAGDCQININCAPGDEWQIDKRAVCKIIINNQDICSGVLINNAKQDGKPYVFTASHCIQSEAMAENSVFIFNYESEDCNAYRGSQAQTISGSKLLAKVHKDILDFALVEITEEIPLDYQPIFAGWTIDDTPKPPYSCIHHPDGDIKKISIDYDKVVSASYGSNISDSFWKISQWDLGATEHGSSGSALFNSQHQVCGTLSGGEYSGCQRPENDFFTKLSVAYDYYKEHDAQLKHWLNPNNEALTYLNAYNPLGQLFNVDAAIIKITNPGHEICGANKISPKIKIQNLGVEKLTKLEIEYGISGISTNKYVWEGDLSMNASKEIVLPGIDSPLGKQTFFVKLNTMGTKADGNTDNNYMAIEVNNKTGNNINLNLLTDRFGHETSWTLTNEQDSILYQGNNYLSKYETNESFCLDDGCFYFTINDKEGDGICCGDNGNGSYTLTNTKNNAVLAEGGAFGFSEKSRICVNQETSKIDLSLESILAPSKNVCGNNIVTPACVVRNSGVNDIIGYRVSYALESFSNMQEKKDARLESGETDTILFEHITLFNGNYLATFSVSAINDEESWTGNNTLDKSIDVGNGTKFQFEIRTDNFGEETTWELKNSKGEIVQNGGPYRNYKDTIQESTNFCLDKKECYTFSIYDTSGDGICCDFKQGHFFLKNLDENEIIIEGDDFGIGLTKEFCLSHADTPTVENIDLVKIYPNPSNGRLKIEAQYTITKIQIFDLTGRLIKEFTPKASKEFLNVSHLSGGLYNLQVSLENGKTTIKKLILYSAP